MPVCESDFKACAERGEVYTAYWDDWWEGKRLVVERQPRRYISYRETDYVYTELFPDIKIWVWGKDIPALYNEA